jgi:hypothetical protein
MVGLPSGIIAAEFTKIIEKKPERKRKRQVRKRQRYERVQ